LPLLSVVPKLPRVRLKSLAIVVVVLAFIVTKYCPLLLPNLLLLFFQTIMLFDKNSHVKLDNKNYKIWAMLMHAILIYKGLTEVATRELPILTTGPNSAVGKAWICKNTKAYAEMILAIETNQLAHMTAKTTAEIWTKLEHVYYTRGLAT